MPEVVEESACGFILDSRYSEALPPKTGAGIGIGFCEESDLEFGFERAIDGGVMRGWSRSIEVMT